MDMKAIMLRQYGGPEMLSFETVPAPVPEEGEVLIRVEAVSVNRGFDIVARQGGSPFKLQLPLILGVDPTGIIVDVGSGVNNSRIGERAFVSGIGRCRNCPACQAGKPCPRAKRIGITAPGGYAEFITVPSFQARTLPPGLDPAEATVIGRHAGVAYAEIVTAEVKGGEWVLVMGAAGALGSFLIQLAKLKGANVIACASSEERLETCRELGADFGVNYNVGNLTDQVFALTDGRGVDVVLENISDPATFPLAFASLAEDGRLVTIGYHGGGIVPVDMKALFMRRLKILSSSMWSGDRDDLAECLAWAAEGKLRAVIGARLPLADATEAHRLVEDGKLIGKVVLQPGA